MVILRNLLHSLQASFSECELGRERSLWFVFILLAIIVMFTSDVVQPATFFTDAVWSRSGTSAFLTLQAASAKLPWIRLTTRIVRD